MSQYSVDVAALPGPVSSGGAAAELCRLKKTRWRLPGAGLKQEGRLVPALPAQRARWRGGGSVVISEPMTVGQC